MSKKHRPSTGPRVEVLSSQNFSFNKTTSGSPPMNGPSLGTKTFAETNPGFYSVDLPSKFYGYPFKTLAVSPLKGLHIAKINRAQKENSLRFLVEALSSTLEPTVSAFDLKPGDFYFLMYWQRVNSYPKSPMLIEVDCTDPAHQLAVIEGVKNSDGVLVKKPQESLVIKEFLTATTLNVKDLVEPDLTEFEDLRSRYVLGYETMRDVVLTAEKVLDSEDGAPDFAFTAGLASFLSPIQKEGEPPLDLAARCSLVDTMSVDDVNDLQRYIDVVTNFGVSESASIRCKECGALTRVNISFNALTFLPNGK